MSEHPQVAEVDSQQVTITAPPEPRWPAVAAFVTAWLCPAISARRTLHVRLWAAYAVHLMAAFLTFVLITALFSLADNKHPLHYLQEIIEEFTSSRWQEAFVALAVSVLCIEIAYLVLALLLTPWGAADERLRSSWSHALRVAWLHTSHALPTVPLVVALSIGYSRAERAYYQTHPYSSFRTTCTPPSLPTAPSDNSEEAWRDYRAAREACNKEYNKKQQEALEQHQRAWREWKRHRPFFIRYGPVAITWIGVACSIWILWALLQAAVVRRPAPPIVHPPLCEFCGYNLTGTPIESRCPECGQLAIDSLGPEVRPGTPWDHADHGGRLRAWWQCGVNAICRPQQFGRQIRIGPQTHRHRRFLATHLPLIFLFGALGVAGCILYEWHRRPASADEPEILWWIPPIFGGLSVLTVLAIAGLAAGLVGLIYSLKNERNLLPASNQMACYLCLYITAWTAFSSALSVLFFVLVAEDKLRPLARQIKMDHDFLLFCLWFLPNLALLAGFLVLLWRGTGAAQYANR